MLINVSEDQEYRIAVVEGGVLEELYLERTKAERHVGDIYVGRVQNVELSIQAAFVELGTGKNGFLHVSDVRPDATDIPPRKSPSTRGAHRGEKNIRDLLKKGDRILVQVTREAIDNKGPSLTTYISLPGKYLVMMPGMGHHGVSRKIQNEDTRHRLKTLLGEMELPKHAGFIIRTAGLDRTKRDLQRDLNYLRRLWDAVCTKITTARAPALVYQESDLIIRCMRDLFTSDTDEVVIDNQEVCRRVREFLAIVSPSYQNRVKLYSGKTPLLAKYGVDAAVDQVYAPRVPLPHGGSIVIEQTEALVAIDVNSGKFTEGTDAEITAYRTNMEATPEIARQLRLRDLGGVIVIDFIDMKHEKHRRDVEKALLAAMRRDRARTKILRMSQFGIIQMTRQRMRPSVLRAVFRKCPTCGGIGHIWTPESLMLQIMQKIRMASTRGDIDLIECAAHPEVAMHVLNEKRSVLDELERASGKRIIIRADLSVSPQEVRLHGVRGNSSVPLH